MDKTSGGFLKNSSGLRSSLNSSDTSDPQRFGTVKFWMEARYANGKNVALPTVDSTTTFTNLMGATAVSAGTQTFRNGGTYKEEIQTMSWNDNCKLNGKALRNVNSFLYTVRVRTSSALNNVCGILTAAASEVARLRVQIQMSNVRVYIQRLDGTGQPVADTYVSATLAGSNYHTIQVYVNYSLSVKKIFINGKLLATVDISSLGTGNIPDTNSYSNRDAVIGGNQSMAGWYKFVSLMTNVGNLTDHEIIKHYKYSLLT